MDHSADKLIRLEIGAFVWVRWSLRLHFTVSTGSFFVCVPIILQYTVQNCVHNCTGTNAQADMLYFTGHILE